LSRTATPCPARRATSVAGTPEFSHSDTGLAAALAEAGFAVPTVEVSAFRSGRLNTE
jgi:hypothetical protein